MIAIIDYDAGNLKSVEKALLYLGQDVLVTRDREKILSADKVILPGVGNFGDAMEKLKGYGLEEVIRETARQGKPFLGICLGLQLLFERSAEAPGVEGLGILKGEILRIPDREDLKVPHIGWNSLKLQNQGRLYGVEARNIVRAATIYTVPMVDPDGVDLVTGAIETGTLQYAAAQRLSDNYPQIPFPEGWKANLLGVDLNVQYPAGWLRAREIKFSQGYTRPGPRDYVGRAPLNQRESIALADFTQEIDPALVLAYHTQGKVIYWQFQDYAVPGARELGEEFARLSGYELADTPYESSFAGYKDWFIQKFRRPGYTIEAGSGQNPLPIEQFPEIYRDNLGVLVTAALGLPH